MIELIGAIARWVQLLALMTIVGSNLFLWSTAYDKNTVENVWLARLEHALPWLAIAVLIGLLGGLCVSTALATGTDADAWHPKAWLSLLHYTQLGRVWILRASLAAMLLAVALYARSPRPSASWRYFASMIMGMLTLVTASLAGHPAADDFPALA